MPNVLPWRVLRPLSITQTHFRGVTGDDERAAIDEWSTLAGVFLKKKLATIGARAIVLKGYNGWGIPAAAYDEMYLGGAVAEAYNSFRTGGYAVTEALECTYHAHLIYGVCAAGREVLAWSLGGFFDRETLRGMTDLEPAYPGTDETLAPNYAQFRRSTLLSLWGVCTSHDHLTCGGCRNIYPVSQLIDEEVPLHTFTRCLACAAVGSFAILTPPKRTFRDFSQLLNRGR